MSSLYFLCLFVLISIVAAAAAAKDGNQMSELNDKFGKAVASAKLPIDQSDFYFVIRTEEGYRVCEGNIHIPPGKGGSANCLHDGSVLHANTKVVFLYIYSMTENKDVLFQTAIELTYPKDKVTTKGSVAPKGSILKTVGISAGVASALGTAAYTFMDSATKRRIANFVGEQLSVLVREERELLPYLRNEGVFNNPELFAAPDTTAAKDQLENPFDKPPMRPAQPPKKDSDDSKPTGPAGRALSWSVKKPTSAKMNTAVKVSSAILGSFVLALTLSPRLASQVALPTSVSTKFLQLESFLQHQQDRWKSAFRQYTDSMEKRSKVAKKSLKKECKCNEMADGSLLSDTTPFGSSPFTASSKSLSPSSSSSTATKRSSWLHRGGETVSAATTSIQKPSVTQSEGAHNRDMTLDNLAKEEVKQAAATPRKNLWRSL